MGAKAPMGTKAAVELTSGLVSEAGHRRRRNEDAALAIEFPGGGLYAVADGLGGHRRGDRASSLALGLLERAFLERSNRGPLHQRLLRACATAHGAVQREGERLPEGMATTLVALAIEGDLAVVAHAGDSRAYLLRSGVLRLLTHDHSWVAEQVRLGLLSGEEAQRHRERHRVSHVLGLDGELQVELGGLWLRPGDRLLLCSDGVSGELAAPEVQALMADAPVQAAAHSLVARANQAAEPDNLTAVVVEVGAVRRHSGASLPALPGGPRAVRELLGPAQGHRAALQSVLLLIGLYAAIAGLALGQTETGMRRTALLFTIGLLLLALLFSSRRYRQWRLDRQFEARMAEARRGWNDPAPQADGKEPLGDTLRP